MQQTTTKIPKGYKQTERYGLGAAAVEYFDRLPKYLRITDI
jgi:hypothetical protein